MIIGAFIFFTALVALLTYFLTRKDDHSSTEGFFLGGRSLTWPLIAGSLLLTNLSTEQMVGLNGSAFTDGLAVMAWEVVAVLALVAMALFFLPRFLNSGVTTVPEYLGLRFDHQTRLICNIIFLSAYTVILLPIILYTGAMGLIGILDIQTILGIESRNTTLWMIIWAVGLIGSVYALFGGLRTVAVSDFINGVGLLIGGLLITWFGLSVLGDGQILEGLNRLSELNEGRMNSIGSKESSVPFSTLFSGVLLLNFFYWTTNQQIIQRTFGASSLAEGQKGVLSTGFLKLLGPLYLVVPGLIAFALFPNLSAAESDQAYGMLVNTVLPSSLAGFFAAVMMGAILSSYNSALNATCTLFSLGIYKPLINQQAKNKQIVRSGKLFGWVISVLAMCLAPLLATQQSIFSYLQSMNGIYFIPIFAVVLMGMLWGKMNSLSAKTALIIGPLLIAAGYFFPPLANLLNNIHEYHFLGMMFILLVFIIVILSLFIPSEGTWVQIPTDDVNMTPWKYSKVFGAVLCILVLMIYAAFAQF